MYNWLNPRTPTANGTSRLDVASLGVNFLMKSDTVILIMTGSPTRAIHVRQKPCTHGLADADIVSAFPLSFNTFQENINTLRQTSRHDIPSTVGVLFLVSAEKLSCEILNLLQITHEKLNMGL